MEPQVIYEDKNFLALDKPAGLLIHPTASSREPTLVNWLLKRYPEMKKVGDSSRPGIVHRLDRDTSGIILAAKNQKYFEYLKNLFQNPCLPAGRRAIKKTYRALVYGKMTPKKGIIEKDIKVRYGTIKRTVFKGRGEKSAVTEYKLLKQFTNFSWLEVTPLTGRTHQIRVHLASIGHPVVGDKLYGPKKSKEAGLPNINRQLLHAYSLEFSPSPGKRLKLAADLPADIKEILQSLKVAKN
ncbi:MAG: RNA pseudouridine synthase [Candidatus Colwellbacteria bacterium]|nr:RNA pseudouridine synthase [Candidatus Colwellbacteria bacterium]